MTRSAKYHPKHEFQHCFRALRPLYALVVFNLNKCTSSSNILTDNCSLKELNRSEKKEPKNGIPRDESEVPGERT